MMSLPKQTILDKQKWWSSGNHTLAQVLQEVLDPRDAVILRLVATDTPSHHGAWKPDSEAWKSLKHHTTPYTDHKLLATPPPGQICRIRLVHFINKHYIDGVELQLVFMAEF
jgi:hypothetical protein